MCLTNEQKQKIKQIEYEHKMVSLHSITIIDNSKKKFIFIFNYTFYCNILLYF